MTLAAGPTVIPLRTYVRVLTPIRAALGGVTLLGALLAGARPWAALLAFVVGGLAGGAFLTGDRRGVRRRLDEPAPLPADALVLVSWWEVGRAGVWPSTVAVTGLSAAALVFDPTLAAALAGVLGGMALATGVAWADLAARERRAGGPLLAERSGARLFVAARDGG